MQRILEHQKTSITILKNIGVKVSYNINFHLSFKPEIAHMQEFLDCQIEKKTKEEIGQMLGIPTGASSGKVIPMMLYSTASNLISYTVDNQLYSIEQSKLGSYIKEIDPFLESYEVQTFIHYHFCTLNSQLSLWEDMFRGFASYYRSFDKVTFISHISNNYSTKITNKSLSPTISTYLDDSCLASLGMLKQDERGKLSFGRIRIISNHAKWYAFYLYDFLKRLDPSRRDFHISDLKSNGFHSIFGWSDEDVFQVLDILEKMKFIGIDKQYNDAYITLHDFIAENIITK